MPVEIGSHKRVFEYDGAHECLDCKARWGAFPGNPQMPISCVRGGESTVAEFTKAQENLDIFRTHFQALPCCTYPDS